MTRHQTGKSTLHRATASSPAHATPVEEHGDTQTAAEALRQAHEESELFINAVPSILIGVNGKSVITRWNQAAERCFRLSKSEVVGKSIASCGIKWQRSDMEAEIDSWRAQVPKRYDNLAVEIDGEIHFLGVTANSVSLPGRDTGELLIIASDVTERRLLEDQLRQAQKLEAIGQLAAGIAHEINTPTQYVGDNTNFLKESWTQIAELLTLARDLREKAGQASVPPEMLERFDAMAKQADIEYLLEEVPRAINQSLDGIQRVAKIVRAMKEFSHPGSEEKCAIDINKAIETTITVARNEWKYVAEVETTLAPDLPFVPCHAGELNQVILNLLINAAHAVAQKVGDGSQGKGKITVTTRREDEWVTIAISDSGVGIPEAIRSRIFEPFFTTKPVGKGTGQGLALAHTAIVRKHGGKIWFESEPGQGTTFFIRLPLAAPAEQP
ncbi:MAG TPA: ATP-binding protein [Terriglobales bacterium]|nr:ATP-binding protein [Terriglobales bacterium]